MSNISGNGTARLDPATVRTMHASIAAQTEKEIMSKFGISLNSWRKIRDGKPVRVSLAKRLRARLIRDGLIGPGDKIWGED